MLLDMDILRKQEDEGGKKAYQGEDEGELAPLKMRKFSVSNVK